MLCLTKCDYMSSSCYVFRKRAHVLTDTITERSRAVAIIVTADMLFDCHDVVVQGDEV